MSEQNEKCENNMIRYYYYFILVLLFASCYTEKNPNEYGDKHSESYIKQRIDSIYSRFNNPTYDENGRRFFDKSNNYDSLFCSSRYLALMSKAIDIMDEDDIILDYDHWTNSQDPDDFNYKVYKIEYITDSTASVSLNASNWGQNYLVTLCLYYEKDDWFVDDFISEYGFKSEKEYLTNYIKRHMDK